MRRVSLNPLPRIISFPTRFRKDVSVVPRYRLNPLPRIISFPTIGNRRSTRSSWEGLNPLPRIISFPTRPAGTAERGRGRGWSQSPSEDYLLSNPKLMVPLYQLLYGRSQSPSEDYLLSNSLLRVANLSSAAPGGGFLLTHALTAFLAYWLLDHIFRTPYTRK